MRKSRGATVIEALISLFILAILMTVFADLVTRYSVIIRHQERKDRSLANIKMALDTVTAEIGEALLVYEPDSVGATETSVRFWRYNPGNMEKKLALRGGITVRYYLDSYTLYREVSSEGLPTPLVSAVAHDVYGFAVSRESSRVYAVKVSLMESSRIYTVEGKACLRPGI